MPSLSSTSDLVVETSFDKRDKPAEGSMMQTPAFKVLDFLNIKNLAFKYKLVYLDPPYNKNIANAALDKIMDINILKKDSIIIIETEKNFIIKNSMQKYIIYTKLYGNIKLNFLRYT